MFNLSKFIRSVRTTPPLRADHRNFKRYVKVYNVIRESL